MFNYSNNLLRERVLENRAFYMNSEKGREVKCAHQGNTSSGQRKVVYLLFSLPTSRVLNLDKLN